VDTVVNFKMSKDGDYTEVTTNKVNAKYTVIRHFRFPSLWVITSDRGDVDADLSQSFTSRPQAENHLTRFLNNKKFTAAAYADARGKKKAPPIKYKKPRVVKPKEA